MKSKLNYWKTVTESFKIIWRNKYLWILGLFSAGSTLFLNFSPHFKVENWNWAQVNLKKLFPLFLNLDFLAEHWIIAMISAAGLFLLVIILIALGCLAQGGLISSVHNLSKPCKTFNVLQSKEKEKKLGFKKSLLLGKKFFWRVLGLDALFLLVILALFLLFLGIPLVLFLWQKKIITALFLGFLGGTIFSFFGFLGLLLFRYSIIAIVLENKKIGKAIETSFKLLSQNLGATILVNLLLWVVTVILSSTYFAAFIILLIPLALIALILFLTIHVFAFPLILLLLFLTGAVIGIVITGFISAFKSTAWTLTYKQLKIQSPKFKVEFKVQS